MYLDEPQKRLITDTYCSNFLFIVARALGCLIVVGERRGLILITCVESERFAAVLIFGRSGMSRRETLNSLALIEVHSCSRYLMGRSEMDAKRHGIFNA